VPRHPRPPDFEAFLLEGRPADAGPGDDDGAIAAPRRHAARAGVLRGDARRPAGASPSVTLGAALAAAARADEAMGVSLEIRPAGCATSSAR
jgi:hypothetical protein